MSNSSSEDDQVKKLLENETHLKRKKTKNIKTCNNLLNSNIAKMYYYFLIINNKRTKIQLK